MSTARQHIGIDLDNTLVCYDALFYQLACEYSLVPDTLPAQKQCVRDYIRQHAGDEAWQGLQALAYDTRMSEACLFPDALGVIRAWKERGYALSIISHKTRTSPCAPEGNLHAAAIAFLAQAGMLQYISPEHIYFLPSRAAKIATIARLGCTVFVDDLPEIFRDENFPPHVQAILFDPHALLSPENTLVCCDWKAMDKQTRSLLHDDA